MEREVGGGIRMGNTCKSMADSCQCMTKPTTIKKKDRNNKKKILFMKELEEQSKLICMQGLVRYGRIW